MKRDQIYRFHTQFPQRFAHTMYCGITCVEIRDQRYPNTHIFFVTEQSPYIIPDQMPIAAESAVFFRLIGFIIEQIAVNIRICQLKSRVRHIAGGVDQNRYAILTQLFRQFGNTGCLQHRLAAADRYTAAARFIEIFIGEHILNDFFYTELFSADYLFAYLLIPQDLCFG